MTVLLRYIIYALLEFASDCSAGVSRSLVHQSERTMAAFLHCSWSALPLLTLQYGKYFFGF